jgi:uncharacterized protein YdiU (UPF0061 family)
LACYIFAVCTWIGLWNITQPVKTLSVLNVMRTNITNNSIKVLHSLDIAYMHRYIFPVCTWIGLWNITQSVKTLSALNVMRTNISNNSIKVLHSLDTAYMHRYIFPVCTWIGLWNITQPVKTLSALNVMRNNISNNSIKVLHSLDTAYMHHYIFPVCTWIGLWNITQSVKTQRALLGRNDQCSYRFRKRTESVKPLQAAFRRTNNKCSCNPHGGIAVVSRVRFAIGSQHSSALYCLVHVHYGKMQPVPIKQDAG